MKSENIARNDELIKAYASCARRMRDLGYARDDALASGGTMTDYMKATREYRTAMIRMDAIRDQLVDLGV